MAENKTAKAEKKKFSLSSIEQKWIVLVVVIVLFLFFCAMSQNFRKYTTFVTILDYSYYITLLSIGVTFPLITAGVDLSIGTGMVAYSLIGGYLVVHMGWPTWAGLLASLVVGALVGTFNGILIAVMDLPPFLATLCTMMMTRGLGSIVTGGFGISWPSLGNGGWFRNIFKISLADNTKIPLGIIWIILVVFIMSFVLNHMRAGRYILAIGSNKEATRLSGVAVTKYHILAYVFSGFFAALGSIAYSTITPTVQPGTGAGVELEAIGGAIIGGVSTTGGSGTIIGSFFGVLVICLLKTGLPYIGLEANWQQIITGLVLIGAVLIDVIKTRAAKN